MLLIVRSKNAVHLHRQTAFNLSSFILMDMKTPLCVSGLGTRIALFSMLRYYRNPSQHNGRISVYHAAGLSTFPLRPTCFPRYFLNLCYDLLSEMVLELMPCALAPA